MKSLPINMLLKKLINNIPEKKNNIFIRGLSTNSKDVKNGYIFFAIKGNNKNGYYIGGKTGTAEGYGNKKSRINSFISVFPTNKPNYTLLVMLENPKINKDLLYEYRGIKTKAPYNTSGWNSVYVAGKIIQKIGPILAINNEEFTDQHVAEKINK